MNFRSLTGTPGALIFQPAAVNFNHSNLVGFEHQRPSRESYEKQTLQYLSRLRSGP